MSNNENKTVGYIINKEELGVIVALDSKIKGNELSRYIGFREDDRVSLSQETLAFINDESFKKVVNIIAQPDLRISGLKGGANSDIDSFEIYAKKLDEKLEFSAVLSSGDIALVSYFAESNEFTNWWCSMFGAKIEAEGGLNNFIPDTMKIDEFVLMLHLIDCYKRTQMESMQIYKPTKDAIIESEEFLTTLKVSVTSGDIRWLLPAFFALTPGLSGIQLSINAATLENFKNKEYISPLENPQNGLLKLIYLNKGVTLGFEFANTWMYGLGWNAEILRGNAATTVSHKFLAPTAYANHVFTAKKDAASQFEFSHKALTYAELENHMQNWITEVEKTLLLDADKTLIDTNKKRFCSGCGSALEPDVVFCGNCGTKA